MKPCIGWLVLVMGTLTVSATDPDPKPLFDGKTFQGWKAEVRPAKDGTIADWTKTWSVEDGILRCSGKPNGYLATTAEYSDYRLRLQWRFPAGTTGGNSGVLLHVQKDRHPWPHCFEAQLATGRAGEFWLTADENGQLPSIQIDPTQKDPENKEGRRYFRIDRTKMVEKPIGDWNQYDIVCRGGAIELSVNGTKTVSGTGGSLTRGRIALQSEGAAIHFRDIELTPLK